MTVAVYIVVTIDGQEVSRHPLPGDAPGGTMGLSVSVEGGQRWEGQKRPAITGQDPTGTGMDGESMSTEAVEQIATELARRRIERERRASQKRTSSSTTCSGRSRQ